MTKKKNADLFSSKERKAAAIAILSGMIKKVKKDGFVLESYQKSITYEETSACGEFTYVKANVVLDISFTESVEN